MQEFGIHGRTQDDGRLSVMGRCFSGPIVLGARFLSARPYLAGASGGPLPVSLRVIAIEAYGRQLDELDEGLTATIRLEGEAPEAIGDGWVLTDDPTGGGPSEGTHDGGS